MREYELTVLYDLSVAESGGADASAEALTTLVEARGGEVLKVDHWGRRRLAYPIGKALDADYVVMRANLEPEAILEIQGSLRINETVYRHLIVRADEIPEPPPPREPRLPRPEAADATPAPGAAVEESDASTPEAPADESPEAPAEASAPVEEVEAEAATELEATVDDAAEPVAEEPAAGGDAEASGDAAAEATDEPKDA